MKKELAYGGVVFNDKSEVLLREPLNHFGDYVWTFAKGRADHGETPETTALREVREETGAVARIVCQLPGAFAGDTTDTVYFLMALVKDTGDFCRKETHAIKWVAPEQAKRLIKTTPNPVGRHRDLAVLEKAVSMQQQRTGAGSQYRAVGN